MTEQAKPLSEEPETTFEIAPVERPIQFDEPQIAFLPEVDAFLWVSQARQAFNVSGAGLTAAVLDTGLNAEHVDFAGRVVAQRNFTPDNGGNPDDAADGNGHGTNVAGIVAAGGIHRQARARGVGQCGGKKRLERRRGRWSVRHDRTRRGRRHGRGAAGEHRLG